MIAAIADEARVVSLWESTHAAAVAKLIDALDSAGIESVLMKGTALAYSVHEEPAARRRGDSDLLVRPDDLEQARLIFEANGWDRAEGPHGVSYQEAWLHKTATHFEHAIDLHWEPSDSAVIQKALTLHDFFDHKRPLPRLSDKAWRSDLAVTMIHETINQKWHISHGYLTEEGKISGARRLIWSVDFDVMSGAMNGADWERLLKLCEARKFGPLVAEALRGAESDLGTIVPEERVGQLEQRAVSLRRRQWLDVAHLTHRRGGHVRRADLRELIHPPLGFLETRGSLLRIVGDPGGEPDGARDLQTVIVDSLPEILQ